MQTTQEKLLPYIQALQHHKNAKDFEKLYQLSSVQLFHIVLRILRQSEMAQECMQEVYLKIWQKVDYYDADKACVMTWMSSIARNYAIDLIRKQKIVIDNAAIIENIGNDDPEQIHQMEQGQENQALYQCLAQLKPEIMDVFILSYFKQMTYEKIAKKNKVPLGTIKSWVKRSLPILKQCLTDK